MWPRGRCEGRLCDAEQCSGASDPPQAKQTNKKIKPLRGKAKDNSLLGKLVVVFIIG